MTVAVDNLVSSVGAVQDDLRSLRRATGQIVGSVFFGTVLKTVRESKLKGPIGHGGRGEEIFGAQLHALWAERIGEAGHGGLADALFRRLAHQQERVTATRMRTPRRSSGPGAQG